MDIFLRYYRFFKERESGNIAYAADVGNSFDYCL